MGLALGPLGSDVSAKHLDSLRMAHESALVSAASILLVEASPSGGFRGAWCQVLFRRVVCVSMSLGRESNGVGVQRTHQSKGVTGKETEGRRGPVGGCVS